MVDDLVHGIRLKNVLQQLHYLTRYLVGFSVEKGCEDFGDVAC